MNIRGFLSYTLSTLSTHHPLKRVFFIYVFYVKFLPQISYWVYLML